MSPMRRALYHPAVRKHFSQLWRFAVCGGTGAMIDLSTTTVLVEYGHLAPQYAYIPSSLLAVLFVFLANKYFTFRNHESRVGGQAFKFAIVYGTAIAFNLLSSWLLLWIGLHYLMAKITSIAIGAIWNYSMSHGFVFKKGEKIDTVVA